MIPDRDLVEAPPSGRLNLATQISAGVDLRLRLAALARKMPLTRYLDQVLDQVLDEALPPVEELAERMKGAGH